MHPAPGRRLIVMRRALIVVVVGVGIVLLAVIPIVLSQSGASSGCTLYVSTRGADSAAGNKSHPYRTVGRLLRALRSGGVGCLGPGRYRESVMIVRGGTSGRPLVLRTQPGRPRATIDGIVTVADSANWVWIESLRIDGTHPQSNDAVLVKIFGDHVTLSQNEIFAGGNRICVETGDANGRFGIARNPTIEENRIHDCGNRATGPKTYPSGHGIYLEADRDAEVRGNVIYDTNYGGLVGGRGIQLWPDSEGATIENNVVDNSNAWNIIISGAPYPTGITRDVVVRNNIFTNAKEYSVTSAWWGGVKPQPGVVVQGNCLWGAPSGGLGFEEWLGETSYTATDNVIADPLYRDPAAKDFRLADSSPCAGKGPDASVARPW